MKQIFMILTWLFALTITAQTEEVVDTIACTELDNPPVPQIPFEDLDSMTMQSLGDRYVVVYKDGKCGVYDFMEEKNVTRIEYDELVMAFRKEIEGGYYTYFRAIVDGKTGLLGISEKDNQFVAVLMSKEEEKTPVATGSSIKAKSPTNRK